MIQTMRHQSRTLCRPCQPPEALSASSARPAPVDSVAMTTTGIRAAAARYPVPASANLLCKTLLTLHHPSQSTVQHVHAGTS